MKLFLCAFVILNVAFCINLQPDSHLTPDIRLLREIGIELWNSFEDVTADFLRDSWSEEEIQNTIDAVHEEISDIPETRITCAACTVKIEKRHFKNQIIRFMCEIIGIRGHSPALDPPKFDVRRCSRLGRRSLLQRHSCHGLRWRHHVSRHNRQLWTPCIHSKNNIFGFNRVAWFRVFRCITSLTSQT